MIDDPEIARLRAEIDRIDTELLTLLRERLRVVLSVGRHKKQHGLAILDAAREEQLLEALVQKASPPLDRALVQAVFQSIVGECRRLEGAGVTHDE